MKQINSFTFDQWVTINGIYGYVDYIGEDVTILVDEQNSSHVIDNSTIRVAYSSQKVKKGIQSVYYLNY